MHAHPAGRSCCSTGGRSDKRGDAACAGGGSSRGRSCMHVEPQTLVCIKRSTHATARRLGDELVGRKVEHLLRRLPHWRWSPQPRQCCRSPPCTESHRCCIWHPANWRSILIMCREVYVGAPTELLTSVAAAAAADAAYVAALAVSAQHLSESMPVENLVAHAG